MSTPNTCESQLVVLAGDELGYLQVPALYRTDVDFYRKMDLPICSLSGGLNRMDLLVAKGGVD